jgi:coatomer subunit gamma
MATVLSLFLSTAKPTLRFSAVRTLNRVAVKYPNYVAQCNQDLEALISDGNRSIATLAITTLLKTGNADNVDRLIQQISHFVSEISDEFKVVVVQSIRQLCQKFPHKHRAMLNFLSDVLREEGGFEYKKTIVDTILNLVDDIPECSDAALTALCEFIEDCEFTALSIRVLNVLGEKGPTADDPSKFIRYIYNRVILEKAPIRAASVTALGKFAQKLQPLRESILVLLRRCQFDHDDEVRDRATFYLQLLASDELAACAGEVIQCPVGFLQ